MRRLIVTEFSSDIHVQHVLYRYLLAVKDKIQKLKNNGEIAFNLIVLSFISTTKKTHIEQTKVWKVKVEALSALDVSLLPQPQHTTSSIV